MQTRLKVWQFVQGDVPLHFLLDFLQARQAVETLFFQVPFSAGGLCSRSFSWSSEMGDDPGTGWRYRSLMTVYQDSDSVLES